MYIYTWRERELEILSCPQVEGPSVLNITSALLDIKAAAIAVSSSGLLLTAHCSRSLVRRAGVLALGAVTGLV